MKTFMVLGFIIGAMLSLLAALSSSEWGTGGSIAAVVYAFLVTFFLVIQVYGFVFSQVSYKENVEEAKFKMLEVEGILCQGSDHKAV